METSNTPRSRDKHKSTRQSKSGLRLQGRCFRCRKKGHIAKYCPGASRYATRLQDLPVEILDLICGHLLEVKKWSPWLSRLCSLRLACKVIHDKTLDFFGRVAFRRLTVRWSYRELCRVVSISQHPHFAHKVQEVYCSDWDKGLTANEYDAAQEELKSADLTSRERRELKQKIRHANFEQMDKSLVQRSATDGIMLALAFQRFPNLKDLLFSCMDLHEDRIPIRRKHNGEGPTTDHIFSMLLSCAGHANLKLQKIRLAYRPRYGDDEGVSVSTLSMPKEVLRCLSDLQCLTLRLETRNSSYKNPAAWQANVATFLTSCPQLRQLTLSFRNDWEDTETIFSAIAARVRLSHLEVMCLEGICCSGVDLYTMLQVSTGLKILLKAEREHKLPYGALIPFKLRLRMEESLTFDDLQAHRNLRRLDFRDLDITGNRSFASILRMLSTTHALEHLNTRQIAQNSFRLYYRTLGKISTSPHVYDFFAASPDFFNDFEEVRGPFKYRGLAEEWEGQKIALMSEDLAVSELSYHPDENPFFAYHWSA